MILYYLSVLILYTLSFKRAFYIHPPPKKKLDLLSPSLNEVHLLLRQPLAAGLLRFVVHHRRVGSYGGDGVETVAWTVAWLRFFPIFSPGER